MDYKEKYDQLLKILRKADDDGLFDERTSRIANVPFENRIAIRKILREEENLQSVS